ncbi:MAG TPA: cupin domain-containing protein [Syntrophales bacterium]|jgi:quercetin dioxygenase-like cupin family protein|nr:cupin domain-containing protein [Syntrophales bacterium]
MTTKKPVPGKGVDIKGRAYELRHLVEYQKGTIVSRTLIGRKAGTVTLFAFDKGQGLSEHTAPYDAMVCALEGEVEIMISGKPHRLGKGGMIIMPARQPHSLKALKKFKMLLVLVRG